MPHWWQRRGYRGRGVSNPTFNWGGTLTQPPPPCNVSQPFAMFLAALTPFTYLAYLLLLGHIPAVLCDKGEHLICYRRGTVAAFWNTCWLGLPWLQVEVPPLSSPNCSWPGGSCWGGILDNISVQGTLSPQERLFPGIKGDLPFPTALFGAAEEPPV